MIMLLCMICLSSCMKHEFNYEEQARTEVEQLARDNAERVLGVSISPTMDWSLSEQYQTKVTTPDKMKVQILTKPPYAESSRVLTEGYGDCTLSYDVPEGVTRLYVALYDQENVCKYIKGISAGEDISFGGKIAGTRGDTTGEEWSNDKYVITTVKETHNNKRTKAANNGDTKDGIDIWKDTGWKDYVAEPSVTGTPIVNMSEQDATDLKAILDAYLGHENGWDTDNIIKIRNSHIFKTKFNYLVATGDVTVQLRPVQAYSTEANLCTLYYYLLNNDNTPTFANEEEELNYIKALPKYKICSFSEFQNGLERHWDGVMYKYEYNIPYFTSKNAEKGVKPVGQVMPKGTKIGFMMRKTQNANNIYSDKQGDLYADGRLNKQINVWGNHFSTSQMNPDDPRMAIFSINEKTYITVEDGSNRNFSDEIFEVSPGVELPGDPIEPEHNIYTFMFEDNLMGDYDMNDVVMTGERISKNKVKWTIMACGANDELYIRGINNEISSTEVHSIFGATRSDFVNTISKNYDYVSFIVDVDNDFSFYDNAPVIYNASRNYVISLPQIGGTPFGVMIPGQAPWATERTCIKDAYPRFTNWIRSNDKLWWQEPKHGSVVE